MSSRHYHLLISKELTTFRQYSRKLDAMGYIFAFFLGIFVATVGVNNTAIVIDNAVKRAQIYMVESTKTTTSSNR